jgi:uncharacterized oligopeptide transporter (OPT) family protein
MVGKLAASFQLQFPKFSFIRGISLNLNRHRSRMRSWAERHHFAIGLALTFVGLAAVGAIHFLGVKGSLATMIGAFAAFALLFGQGFRWNRGPIFPPSEINRKNRWKYLVFAAILWGSLFLLWWFRIRPLAK